MSLPSSPLTKWNELLDLLWCCLNNGTSGGVIDDETIRFFMTPTPAALSTVERPISSQPTPISEEDVPAMNVSDETVESSKQPPQRHLEKLLPRPFSPTPIDTTTTRKSIGTTNSIPTLSQKPLYQELLPKRRNPKWAIFSYLTSSSTPSPKECFFQSVSKAISERLHIDVSLHSCYDPAFVLHLPIIVLNCDVIFFFVDNHLNSSLITLLNSVQSFTRSSQAVEPPFISLGSVHDRPLRAFLLHPSTHEDAAIKADLWRSLKALVSFSHPS